MICGSATPIDQRSPLAVAAVHHNATMWIRDPSVVTLQERGHFTVWDSVASVVITSPIFSC